MNNTMSQAQKVARFSKPTNQEVYLVTQTRKPFTVIAIFQHIEDACNYMDNLPGMHSIQRRTINATPVTTISYIEGFCLGWIM